MVERLRTPFFVAALVLALLVVLIELGALAAGALSPPGDRDLRSALDAVCGQKPPDPDIVVKCLTAPGDLLDQMRAAQKGGGSPGLGITYMALVDGLLLYMTLLMGVSLVIPQRVTGRFQGIVTLVFSVLMILLAIGLILLALAKLILMVSLLLATPFGTLAYLAIWGFFDRGTASAVLGLLWLLKLGYGVALVLAQQRFLANRGLLLLFAVCLLVNIVVSFLQGLVPGFLVSITDAIAAIVVGIVAVIMLILTLIGSVIGTLKAV